MKPARLAALTLCAIVSFDNVFLYGHDRAVAVAQQPTQAPQELSPGPAVRDATRREMQVMLRSLNTILQGLSVGDFAMVEKGARASGKEAALDPVLVKMLPAHFVDLDTKIHRRFGELADAVKSGGNKDVSKRLAAITGYCVTCHEMFRY